MRKFYFTLFILFTLALTLTGCSKSDTLKVGTEATFAPFEFTNDQNEVIGFDIDIATEIGQKLGKKVEIVNMDFGGLIGALQANQIDLAIAGMSITPDRQEKVNFSSPYYDASQVIVVRSDETGIQSRNELAGKTIAVQMGTTGADAAMEISNAKVKQFGKVNEAFLEMKNKRADAVIIDAPVAKEYLKQMTDLKIASKPFTEEQYGIAIKKENTDLLKEVNQALQELVDSGRYQEIYDKWFKQD